MKNVICMAWSWFCATVEIVMPSARFAATKSSTTASSSGMLPSIGTWNRKRAANRITATCT